MKPGTPYAGGLFAANYFIGDEPFALIVSPRDAGDLDPAPWGGKKNITEAASHLDGLANTAAMAAARSTLAQQVMALRIDGHDDWYLPSRLESLLLFGNVPEQFEREWYWTSTQYAGYDESAWLQTFDDGDQVSTRKASRCRARAVRRVPIR